MPQSAEHLAALDALGVRHGLLVVTRSDLADPGRRCGRPRARSPRTSLGASEAVAVSAVTGRALPSCAPRSAGSSPGCRRPTPTRRCGCGSTGSFTVRGSGTVVTGTLRRGPCAPATSWAHPGPARGAGPRPAVPRRAGRQVSGVARVALNLRGVSTGNSAAGWRSSSRPLDGNRRDRCPPGADPARTRTAARRSAAAAADHAAHRGGARRGRGADAGQPFRQAEPGPPAAAARRRPGSAPRSRRSTGPRADGRSSARRCLMSHRCGCAATVPPRPRNRSWPPGTTSR